MHLYYGTRQQNVDDMHARGRAVCGERVWNSRLTGPDVISIRERYAAGELQRVLALEFGVTSGHISEIINGKLWRHVGGPLKGQK